MDQNMGGGGQHGAEHVDQADHRAADADHAAADLVQHARDRHRVAFDYGFGLHAAHFVDQGGIVLRQARDLCFDAALGQAAAQPLDQPGAKGVELGDLRDIDEDVGTAAGELFGVGDHWLQHRRKTGGPRASRQQRKSVALCNPLQCRVAVHDAISRGGFPSGKLATPPPSPCRICH